MSEPHAQWLPYRPWRDAAIRALRTFAQTFLGVFLAGLLGHEVVFLGDLADVALVNQATAAGIVAVLAFAQNALELLGAVPYDRA